MFLAQDTMLIHSFLLVGLTRRGISTLAFSIRLLAIGFRVPISVRGRLLRRCRSDTKLLNVLENNEEPAQILRNSVLIEVVLVLPGVPSSASWNGATGFVACVVRGLL